MDGHILFWKEKEKVEVEATYEAQQQLCEKKTQYQRDSEDDVNHWICLGLTKMSGITCILH